MPDKSTLFSGGFVTAYLLLIFIGWLIIGPLSKSYRELRRKPGRPYSLVIHFGKGLQKMLTINSDSPGSAATLNATDRHGVNRALVGVPAWKSSDESIATVTPAADGLSALVVPVAKGECDITVTAEGDPTPGVDTLTGVGHVVVTDPEASQLSVSFGPPQ